MCFGPLRRVCHWGPLTALGIIKSVTFTTVVCLSQWWPPTLSLGGSVMFTSFMASAMLSLYYFLQSMFTGPGTLPLAWSPKMEEECKFLQFCSFCKGYKAPRAHHCRKCGVCIMKMDHHCPWINNCVGHKNHTSFTLFLFWAVVGCMQATIVLFSSIYRAVYRKWFIYYGTGTEPIVYMTPWFMVVCMFVLGLAIGVVLAVGMLLYFQLRSIVRNRTGIEDWILEKALHRKRDDEKPFTYPYDLGWKRNISQVLNIWCEPIGNGIEWNVRDGCHQYTLTIEQLEQKMEKKARSRQFLIKTPYSGWWFPCSHGFGVCCHPPFTDEPRIKLEVGDVVTVTRWKRYWLYGELKDSADKKDVFDLTAQQQEHQRHRGWFPRCCGVDLCSYLESEAASLACGSVDSVRNRRKPRVTQETGIRE